jgi:hypothetical protein
MRERKKHRLKEKNDGPKEKGIERNKKAIGRKKNPLLEGKNPCLREKSDAREKKRMVRKKKAREPKKKGMRERKNRWAKEKATPTSSWAERRTPIPCSRSHNGEAAERRMNCGRSVSLNRLNSRFEVAQWAGIFTCKSSVNVTEIKHL